MPVLDITGDFVELVEFLQPRDVVDLLVLLVKRLINRWIVLVEVWILLTKAYDGSCTELSFAERGQSSDVDEIKIKLVHVNVLSQILFPREKRLTIVRLYGTLIEPICVVHFRHTLIHRESAMVVFYLLHLVIEVRPDV